jgi:hypothetical protein
MKASTTTKVAVKAPMPMANDNIATQVNPSCADLAYRVPQVLAQIFQRSKGEQVMTRS